MKRFFFYCVDPGAVSVLEPIFFSSPCGVKCEWIAEGYAESYFEAKRESYLTIDSAKRKINKGDVVIIGGQTNFARTAEIIEVFLLRNAKTIFIFDHWSYYLRHFTLLSGKKVFPDSIFVMDEYVESELKRLGVTKTSIKVVGHPGIESIVGKVKKVGKAGRQCIRKKLFINNKSKVILLALEPLTEDFKKTKLEYNEFSITKLICQTLEKISLGNAELVVRLHPRQSSKKYKAFLESEKLTDRVSVCPDIVTEAESLHVADVVIGMYSVFLMKAMILGKKALSLQFLSEIDKAANWEEIPPLEKIKIKNPSDLGTEIRNGLTGRSKVPQQFFLTGSVEKVWKEMVALT